MDNFSEGLRGVKNSYCICIPHYIVLIKASSFCTQAILAVFFWVLHSGARAFIFKLLMKMNLILHVFFLTRWLSGLSQKFIRRFTIASQISSWIPGLFYNLHLSCHHKCIGTTLKITMLFKYIFSNVVKLHNVLLYLSIVKLFYDKIYVNYECI